MHSAVSLTAGRKSCLNILQRKMDTKSNDSLGKIANEADLRPYAVK